ncbi:MAG: hypothetical protein GY806_06755 [Gammaproteobacteria bacterium]|nr:hypothetical protein [Gammaproteobacteria bacterium]
MKLFLLIVGLVFSCWSLATESTVTVPWQEFDEIYKDQITQDLIAEKVAEPDPIVTLEDIRYDFNVLGSQVTGSVSISGSVLVGDPEPVHLFGQNIAVTDLLEATNATLLANDGGYALYTFDPGSFSIRFVVSIPVTDFQVKPRLIINVPQAVRNELKIQTSESLRIIESDSLHKVGQSYYFSPRRVLSVDFEHANHLAEGTVSEHKLLSEVDTPDAVLQSVSFFTSFAEDGTVLSAMHLLLPANDSNQLELNPIEDAEVWSLRVNEKTRSLYLSADGKWVIPLDPKVESKVVLAYLTRNQKLGLEGRLDFTIPATDLTARKINLIVGLPERMHMLAMDSDLQPASGKGLPVFKSFSGQPHYFSKPFYRGRAIPASVIYQEPVNP